VVLICASSTRHGDAINLAARMEQKRRRRHPHRHDTYRHVRGVFDVALSRRW